MKGRWHKKRPHWVPLAPEAVEVVKAASALAGGSPFLFASPRGNEQGISDAVLKALLSRAGYEDRQTPHGFRASFSMIMNERRPEDRAFIDMMLAHRPSDAVEAVYNRAEHAARRRAIAEEWATLIIKGVAPAATLLALPRVGRAALAI